LSPSGSQYPQPLFGELPDDRILIDKVRRRTCGVGRSAVVSDPDHGIGALRCFGRGKTLSASVRLA
jgi:hypothetical protein